MEKFYMRSLCFIMLALMSLLLSCSNDIPCEDNICNYDGDCIDGNCICTKLTEEYIVGSWLRENSIDSAIITFNADYTIIDASGGETIWSFDSIERTFKLGTIGYTFIVSEDDFSCNGFMAAYAGLTVLDDNPYSRQ